MKYIISFFIFLFLSTSFFAQYDESFSQITLLYSDFTVQSKQFLEDDYIDKNEVKKLNKLFETINKAEAKFINPKNGLTEENKAFLNYIDSKQNTIDSIASCFYETIIVLTICEKASNIDFPEIMHLDYFKQEVYGFDLINKYSDLIIIISAVNQDEKISVNEISMVKSLSDEIFTAKTIMQNYFSDYKSNLKLSTFFDSQIDIIDSLIFQLWDLSKNFYSFSNFTDSNIPCDFYFNYGYPEFDAKKMIVLINKYTDLAIIAAEDKKLEDIEIANLKILGKELEDFEKEMEDKYMDDKVGKDRVDKYLQDKKAELNIVYEAFFEAMMALYECEGADKLD